MAAGVALVEVGAATGGSVAGEEEGPVVVVEVAVGAGHILAGNGGPAEFAAELDGVAGAGVADGFRYVDDTLAVEEVPGVTDTGGRALGIDVDGGHERGEAADGCFEGIKDAKGGVSNVAEFGDASVKELEEAATKLRDPLSAKGLGVLEAGGIGGGEAEGGRRRGVGPAEGLFDVGGGADVVEAEAVGGGEVMVDGAGACPGVEERGEGLLEQAFVAEVGVAGERQHGRAVGGQQELPVALLVQNVDRNRVDILCR